MVTLYQCHSYSKSYRRRATVLAYSMNPVVWHFEHTANIKQNYLLFVYMLMNRRFRLETLDLGERAR